MAAAGPPVFGALIVAAEYPAAWALCGLFPLAAAPLVPARLVPPGLDSEPPPPERQMAGASRS